MKIAERFLKSFQIKLTLAIISALFAVVLMSDLLIHQFALDAQFQQLRGRLTTLARVSAMVIDAEALKVIPLTQMGMETQEYKLTRAKLQAIRDKDPFIGFIYIVTQTQKDGIFQFIVDADPFATLKGDLPSYPGTEYDGRRFPEMVKGFHNPTADRKLEKDEWGVTLSGYAPIIDRNGKTVALLGVDMFASDVYATQQAVHIRIFFVIFFGIIISILLGMALSAKIAGPVKKLIEGTRRIGAGDLEYTVKVQGGGEIAELADSFNKMAVDLSVSQQKNRDYFYGVIQSLVRIVEAKDPYTRGHSERVAEYAFDLALRMGFSEKEAEALRQTAVLHDIGKLAIHDDILNKKTPLTAEEWEAIRRHPVIGEDILKPVSLDPEMLAIVRGHHERYDGAGYPDQLRGEKINIFAQILSVADAYDAMTSSRAYRNALTREAAVKELEKNKGTQFSATVVDVFVKVVMGDGWQG